MGEERVLHVFTYFRNPAFIQSVPEKNRPVFEFEHSSHKKKMQTK